MDNIKIRLATLDDAEALLKIYAPYVENTAISFELTIPTLAEFRQRIADRLTKYPYIVAEENGVLLGYAYTSSFIARAAYDYSAETTIYLAENAKHKGLGRRLYQVLENISRAQNILNLNACIGYPREDDEYLTKNSAEFHSHLGFNLVGTFHNSGYKFNRWYDMIWMEKLIGQHAPAPAPVIPLPKLGQEKLIAAGLSTGE